MTPAEIAAAQAALQANGFSVTPPAAPAPAPAANAAPQLTPEMVAAAMTVINAFQAQQNGGQQPIAFPNVIFKEQRGKDAAINHLRDQFGISTNTPMGTGATGYGAELVPAEQLSKDIFEIAPSFYTFLDRLPGQHNDKIAKNAGDSVTVPVIGIPAKMTLEAEKSADTAFGQQKGSQLATDNVTLTTKKFVSRFDITRELSDFSVMNAGNFEQRLKKLAAANWVNTFESCVINGDTATAQNTNINLIDGTPGGTEHYLACDGLRKTAIACTSPNGDPDLGAADITDVYTMKKVCGKYFKKNEFLWLTNIDTRDKFSALDNFTDASKRGGANTVENEPLDRLAGADLLVHDDVNNTNAAGKISATPGNNTKGGIIGFWTPAVQYGWIGNLFFKLYDFGSQGFMLEFWGYGAITIVNQKAGYSTYSTVVNGINITL